LKFQDSIYINFFFFFLKKKKKKKKKKGILTDKDIVFRVLATGMDPKRTAVHTVMTMVMSFDSC